MAALVQGSVPRALVKMAVPMLAGTFAMNAYSLTDTYFVSRLGTPALAAMGFSFPVVMLLTCIARGIGTGVTALVAHALGRHHHEEAATLVTHGGLLTVAVTVLMSVGGYALIGPVFTRLGADGEILALIGQYMGPWYLGAIFMTLPMVGNGILISTGDSRAASWAMVLGTLLNLALDPIMIFGYLGCPAMGIAGAAWATVIAQAVSTWWTVHLLWRKHRLVAWRAWRWGDYGTSLGRIAGMAVPSILSLILMPVSATVVTKILSGFGHEAVAACGAASRLEMFAFVVPMALGISLTPFVSQNFGAGRVDRVREACRVANVFALAYGGLVAVAFFTAAPWMAGVFTDDPRVAAILTLYVRIISFGYGMMEVHRYGGFFLTGLHLPLSSTALNGVRVLVLLIPLSFLGAWCDGIRGVFFARLVTDLLSGALAMLWTARTLALPPPPAAGPPVPEPVIPAPDL